MRSHFTKSQRTTWIAPGAKLQSKTEFVLACGVAGLAPKVMELVAEVAATAWSRATWPQQEYSDQKRPALSL